jgi:hypothetical protein
MNLSGDGADLLIELLVEFLCACLPGGSFLNPERGLLFE